jgi:hypothetical protein
MRKRQGIPVIFYAATVKKRESLDEIVETLDQKLGLD